MELNYFLKFYRVWGLGKIPASKGWNQLVVLLNFL